MQVKTAYAITDHFGIAAAYFSGKENDKYNQHSIYDDEAKSLSYRRKLGEISAGYFSSVNTRTNLFLELYAGYGLGRNSIKESYRQPYYGGGFYSNNYDLFFLQPGIALHHKNLFQVGIFLRTSLVSFKNSSTTYTDDILMNKNVRLYELNKHGFVFFQPALSLRLPLSRKGNLNLNTEINGSFNLSAIPIYNRTAIVLMGITYSPRLKK